MDNNYIYMSQEEFTELTGIEGFQSFNSSGWSGWSDSGCVTTCIDDNLLLKVHWDYGHNKPPTWRFTRDTYFLLLCRSK